MKRKLTALEVSNIKTKLFQKTSTTHKLAKQYDVSQSVISGIKNKKTYKEVN